MPTMSPPAGPVEWVAITFPGPNLGSAVTAPLAALVDAGTVRVLDAVVVHKDPDGTVTEGELEDEGAAFDEVDGEALELLSHDDLLSIAERLERGTTTLVLIWENLWATRFADAVNRHGGSVLAHDRVSAADVDRAVRVAAQEGTPA